MTISLDKLTIRPHRRSMDPKLATVDSMKHIPPPSEPPKDAWVSTDALGEMLHSMKMDGVIYSRAELTAPWGIDLPAMSDMVLFHVVTSGHCWLEMEHTEPHMLKPGEFALVPHGHGHQITSRAGGTSTNIFDLPREHVSNRYEILRHGGGGDPTTLLCGAVRFDHRFSKGLLQSLPRFIHIETWNSPQSEWMHSTLRLMAAEASDQLPGGETVVTRLADILVIQAIRSWLAQSPTTHVGWIGAIHDELIGPAILRVHRNPSHDWTVAALAKEVSMSRSAFSARFSKLVGESPMQFVTNWRMYTAATWLKESHQPIAELANKFGYNSEAAFSRAFKRVVGETPGAIRKAKTHF